MLALAKFTLKGPYQAAVVVGLTASLAILLAPLLGASLVGAVLALILNLTSVTLVGLVVLTQGMGSGFKPLSAAAVLVLLTGWILSQSLEQGLAILVMQWLPVIVLTQTLRSSTSLALTLLVGVALGVVAIGFQQGFWMELEADLVRPFLQLEGESTEAEALFTEQLKVIARMVMLLMISSLYLTQILMVFIARWMQARLTESKAFGREFRELALGKPAAAMGALIILAAIWWQQAWMVSLAFLVGVAFMLQGIAIVHSRLAPKRQSFPLLVLFYLLLIFMLQITGVITAIAGMVDNWVGFRKKPETPNTLN